MLSEYHIAGTGASAIARAYAMLFPVAFIGMVISSLCLCVEETFCGRECQPR